MAQPEQRKLPLRRKLLFTCVLLVIPFGVVELGLRLVWTRPPAQLGGALRSTDLFERDEALGWRLVPNRTVNHSLYEGHGVTIHTNSRGFRDVEHGEKSDGKRIVVLGDSFVFGYGVENDEILTAHLGRILGNVDVVNLGVTAYNLVQEHELLKREGLLYRPDVVVVALCQNDVTSDRIPDVGQAKKAREQKSSKGLKAFLNKHVYLYAAVTGAVQRSKPLSRFLVRLKIKEPLGGYEELDTNVRPSLKKYPASLEADWKAMVAELDAIKATCDKAGIPLLVAPIPARQAVERRSMDSYLAWVDYDEDDFDPDKPYRALAEVCEQRGISFTSPLGAFRKEARVLYTPYDMHFSSKGHRLFAEQIAPAIRKLLGQR